MSEQNKPWAFVVGTVQAFTKDGQKQSPVKTHTMNDGQTVYNLTIKTINQNYVDIAIWGNDYGDTGAKITEGCVLFVNGPVSQREHNGKVFTKIDAKHLNVLTPVARLERQVVNAAPQQVVQAPVQQVVQQPVAQPAAAPAGNTFAL